MESHKHTVSDYGNGYGDGLIVRKYRKTVDFSNKSMLYCFMEWRHNYGTNFDQTTYSRIY